MKKLFLIFGLSFFSQNVFSQTQIKEVEQMTDKVQKAIEEFRLTPLRVDVGAPEYPRVKAALDQMIIKRGEEFQDYLEELDEDLSLPFAEYKELSKNKGNKFFKDAIDRSEKLLLEKVGSHGKVYQHMLERFYSVSGGHDQILSLCRTIICVRMIEEDILSFHDKNHEDINRPLRIDGAPTSLNNKLNASSWARRKALKSKLEADADSIVKEKRPYISKDEYLQNPISDDDLVFEKEILGKDLELIYSYQKNNKGAVCSNYLEIYKNPESVVTCEVVRGIQKDSPYFKQLFRYPGLKNSRIACRSLGLGYDIPPKHSQKYFTEWKRKFLSQFPSRTALSSDWTSQTPCVRLQNKDRVQGVFVDNEGTLMFEMPLAGDFPIQDVGLADSCKIFGKDLEPVKVKSWESELNSNEYIKNYSDNRGLVYSTVFGGEVVRWETTVWTKMYCKVPGVENLNSKNIYGTRRKSMNLYLVSEDAKQVSKNVSFE